MNLTFKVNQAIETVFEYLMDMQKFTSIHPVISKIKPLKGNNYLVYETLKVGFIPFSFTYPVSVESNFEDKKITIKAVVMKFTKIEMNYTLHTENNITVINEIINFNSVLPVEAMMASIFKKQHKQLFKNMEAIGK
jgi:carbon monoxide dehydrogenase subunit G